MPGVHWLVSEDRNSTTKAAIKMQNFMNNYPFSVKHSKLKDKVLNCTKSCFSLKHSVLKRKLGKLIQVKFDKFKVEKT